MRTLAIQEWRFTQKLDQMGFLKFFDLRRNAVMALIGLAVYGSGVGVVHFAQKTSGYYGPQPLSRVGAGYSFTRVGRSFKGFNLNRTWEWSRDELQGTILSTLPPALQPRLKPYLTHTLELCQRYNVDPFWALSIMWTESHFDPKALSHANAMGMMQIMPDTGIYLSHAKGQRTPRKVLRSMLVHPHTNIDLGIFYLSRLLKRYKGNYIHATVAYNMGPGWVSKRLRSRLPVGKKNRYLDKVREAYKSLSTPYARYIRYTQPVYKKSFAYRYAKPGYSPIAWYETMREVEPGFLRLPRLASHP
tara:strand:- start:210 stop:1118 length:909 start_codon:yes stop_codon:yes gene_type:complete